MRRLAVAGLLPLLLVAGVRSDWKLFTCRVDHAVTIEPCCPEDDSDDVAIIATNESEDGCCDVRIIRGNQAPFAAPAPDGRIASAPTEMAAPSALAHPALPVVVVSSWTRPTILNTGPPVFLRTRSLLI